MRPIRTHTCYHERVIWGWLGVGLILSFLPEVTYGNSTVGSWGPLQTLSYRPVHSNLLATGKVFWWGSSGQNPSVWDPATGLVTNASPINDNIFCGGHSLLSSGEVFVTGGTITIPQGIKAASSYNALTNTWSRLLDMNAGRFYPTNATLANGDVVVISGNKEDAFRNLIPQVWQVQSRSWRNLTSASVNLPLYPAAFLAPNGKIFVVGTDLSYYVSTTGAGALTTVAAQNASRRDNYGSAAMYDYGKVIYTGGGKDSDVPHSSVEMIDLTATNPVWTYAASMPQPRRQHNATLLPDGTVLVTGGSSASGKNTNDGPKPAINWDPATNQWTIWATETRYRGYHSEALLLPDARVASIGGNYEPSLQIFSPPYLFEPNRPEITSAPASVAYGAQFHVGTPQGADIGNVNLVRPGSVTHANNMDQRICKLSFTTGANVLNVTAPSTGSICPPGYYMLFLINSAGVPSVASFVQLASNPSNSPPPSPPPAPPPPPPSPPPPPPAPPPNQPELVPQCSGNAATIFVQDGFIVGGINSGMVYEGRLRGSVGSDIIVGTTGNDILEGLGGNDSICGGAGNDTIKGGRGKDRLFGQAGKDKIVGGAGSSDRCSGGSGKDTFTTCERIEIARGNLL